MCHFVYIASPLTLSEVRSMLPADLVAELLTTPDRQALLALHYDAQDAMRILHGRCSCDLIKQRLQDPAADEVVHRQRYRHLGYDRSRIIRYLEEHRRAAQDRRPRAEGYWGKAFNIFVAEHARNAGATLYYRHFSQDGLSGDPGLKADMKRLPVDQVKGPVSDWLPENVPLLVG